MNNALPADLPAGTSARVSRFLLVPLLLCIAGVAVAVIRHHDSQSLANDSRKLAIQPVSVVFPSHGNSTELLVLPAAIEAYTEASVFARSNGYMRSWSADIGSRVRKGETLAVVDTPELDQQVRGAAASLEQASANLHLAHTTAARYEGLEGSEAVSQQDVDQTRQGLRAQQAFVQVAAAESVRLKKLQGFEQVVAPFDGVITRRGIDIGDLVNAGRGATGTELFHLAQVSVVRVFLNVPETNSANVSTGMEAVVEPLTLPGEKFTGRVVRSSRAIDPASHTLRVEVDVPNPAGRMLPGTFANVTLHVGDVRPVLIVPSEAVLYQAAGPQVAVVTNGRIALRKVRLGTDFGETIEVLDGVGSGDAVVSSPPDYVLNGTPVAVVAKAH
ncbi:efflux RND transporter periplasmic adaptor subunit [Terriglobus roseus]|uniref:RND family efflux transporter, MFP subunit n=1 Tax=Terriglobus roseus TaxID=392734 RepID=A0A1H4J153_9BACT|nr:efflux RND transporter periplasmic adaptor subunit [Terriglobus roseus]SEB39815.1 RND family efflux transporter, MFP subunit [Terriglobus roseus]